MDWQPIETAPKDSTPILLWLSEPILRRGVGWRKQAPCPNITIGLWGDSDPDYDPAPGGGAWVSIETEDCGSMGGEMTGWMSAYYRISVKPTHWMPIPIQPNQVADRPL